MNFFRGFTSAFLAMLIANPLCCCFENSMVEKPVPQVSCCSYPSDSNQETPVPGGCPCCQAKNLRLADGGKSPVLTVNLPELETLPDLLLVPAILANFSAFLIATVPPPEARPPRSLLILQQRFLI